MEAYLEILENTVSFGPLVQAVPSDAHYRICPEGSFAPRKQDLGDDCVGQ